MIATDTIAALEAAVAANPEDWATRMVLADAYDDVGETVRGNGQRWQGVKRKRPYIPHGFVSSFCWYDDTRDYSVNDPQSDLPRVVYQCLKEAVEGSERYQKFATRPAAELALADALHRLGIVAEVPS